MFLRGAIEFVREYRRCGGVVVYLFNFERLVLRLIKKV